MILFFLVLLCGLQWTAYSWLDTNHYGNWKVVLASLLMLGNCLLFPLFFVPETKTNCGIPVLGVYMAFWIFGNSTTLLIHLSYHLLPIHKKTKR